MQRVPPEGPGGVVVIERPSPPSPGRAVVPGGGVEGLGAAEAEAEGPARRLLRLLRLRLLVKGRAAGGETRRERKLRGRLGRRTRHPIAEDFCKTDERIDNLLLTEIAQIPIFADASDKILDEMCMLAVR